MRKVNMDTNGIATFNCPLCKKSGKRDLTKQKNYKSAVKVTYTCPCGFSDRFIVNRRLHMRKEINVKGLALIDKNLTTKLVTIVDVSDSGMSLIMETSKNIVVGDTLSVSFFLKGNRSFQHKEIIIKRKNGSFFGAKSIEPDQMKTEKIMTLPNILRKLQSTNKVKLGFGLDNSYYSTSMLNTCNRKVYMSGIL